MGDLMGVLLKGLASGSKIDPSRTGGCNGLQARRTSLKVSEIDARVFAIRKGVNIDLENSPIQHAYDHLIT